MSSELVYGTDKQWEDLGLYKVLQKHEMTFCRQEQDMEDTFQGSWWAADDETLTIFHGTFGDSNSPGASHFTCAQICSDEETYQREVKYWESQEEYLEEE